MLTITTTPGVLQNEALSLPVDTTAGQYSILTLQAKVQHTVPMTGRVIVTFPKWNPFATSNTLRESYVSVSANPGQVKCEAILGFSLKSSTDLFC